MRVRGLIGRSTSATILVLLLALSATSSFGLDPHTSIGQFGRRSWQTDTGLPQNTVRAVTQTRDGYLWIGTEAGLVRFDGVSFVLYDKEAPARLRNSSISTLFQADETGDLWIGTDDGLVRRRGEEFTTFSTTDGLPSNTIWSVLKDEGSDHLGKGDHGNAFWVVTPDGIAHYRNGRFSSVAIGQGVANAKSVSWSKDGSVWVGTRDGLLHFDADGVLLKGTPVLPGVEIQAVAATEDGRVWVGTAAGLSWFPQDQPGRLSPVLGLPSDEVTTLAAARDGSLWIGTAKGIAVYQNGVAQGLVSGTHVFRQSLLSERIESIWEDREGAQWAATSRGIARIFDGRVEAFASPDALAGSLVLTSFEDREGSLWLGTESGGLEMVHDQKFNSYTTAQGMTGDVVRSIFEDRDGVIWVGTNGGGLNRFDHGRFTAITTANGLSSNIVFALGRDGNGDLWAGTPDGLNRIHNGKVGIILTSADGLADDFVRSLYAASDGSLWVGTRRGLSHLQNGRFTNYSRMDGLGSDLVGAMIEGPEHSLWIGTLGGLSHFAHGKFTTLTTRDGLTSNVITALYQDRDGSLWIGTNEGGLNQLRDGKITAYPPGQTHLPESVYGILEDGGANLWLSSKTGIYRVARRELQRFAEKKSNLVISTVYGVADGMKISECSSGGHPAAWKSADGTMWFATLKGVATVDPEHLALNTVPPPVVIDQVLVDDQPVTSGGALTVDPGRSRFEFHYAGLSFIAPQKVRFRYKLDGFDHGWVDAGVRRTAYYTNLSPGRYRFHVLACNNDGVWNETGASLDFRLQPRYYQTYWFYLLLLAGAALLAYQGYRWRLQQAQLRFDAVLSERGRIAREIHDTLAQGLVGISVQLEVVNRLLASSIENARAQLDQARALVRESLTEARSSIWELRSQSGETEDLATRIARMATAMTGRTIPAIEVKSKASGIYRQLSQRTEGELLKIAQEAVTNAVRHGQPSLIVIELRFSLRELLMMIRDNGCGFDGQSHSQSSGPEGHFGLTGMRERAEGIGGRLTVQSTPGSGTAISLQLPIDGK